MKKNGKNAWRTLAAISLFLSLAALLSPIKNVAAEGITAGPTPAEAEVHHKSLLRISSAETLPVTRQIKLGINKSMLVELPVEVRDVLVSNPKLVEAVVSTSQRVYLIGVISGQANAFFFDKNGDQILTLEISVERDTASLSRLLHRLIPNSNIKIEVLNDTLVLTGSVRTPAASNRAAKLAARFMTRPGASDKVDKEKVINMLSVQSKEQVLLKVTIAEINRNTLKQVGVNLGANLDFGKLAITALTANAFPLTGAALLAAPQFSGAAAPSTALTPNSFQNSGITGLNTTGKGTIGHTIRALERNGLIRTLAEPNLTAISGETASFLAGGEFPIPVPQSDGTITIDYKEFGVGLSFTPMVLAADRISMKINTEVSELTQVGAIQVSGFAAPGLSVRRTKTTVELPSGGSLVISGLISNETKQNIDGLPGIKNLPVLGALFRSQDFQKKETELIVIVTPYLVNPVARQKLARPDDGFIPASDLESKLLGRLNNVYGSPTDEPLVGSYKGDYGFIVE